MKTAGVIIDSWKLSIFKKYLDAANFSYTENHGIDNTIVLKVEYKCVSELQPVVEAAEKKCKEHKQGVKS